MRDLTALCLSYFRIFDGIVAACKVNMLPLLLNHDVTIERCVRGHYYLVIGIPLLRCVCVIYHCVCDT